MSIIDNWPLVYKKNLYVHNCNNNIGIVTYWSNIEYIKNLLVDFSNICIIGNAYSKILSLNPMLINISSNRFIRYLILCGDDKENAEEYIISFFHGNLIDSLDNEYKESLSHVKKQITLLKCSEANLNNVISSLTKLDPYPENPINISELLKPKSAQTWNSHDSGYVLRSDNLKELFFKVNQKIMLRGKNSKIRDNAIKEINNLMTIYTGPILDELDDCFLISKKRIQDYYDEFKNKILPQDQPYTYSTRLFIDNMILELVKDKFSKRSYSPIFYPTDYDLNNNPCAVGMHLLIIESKLNATIYFRSNDMFRAWPLNMLGFRYQQNLIATSLGYPLGATTIVSSSAQIYSENWDNANNLISQIQYIKNKYYDPEGYFICSKEEDDTILVNYYNTSGQIQWMWQKPSSDHEILIDEIATHITDPQHIGYLAKEVTKLAYNIYTENSANKLLSDNCTSSCLKN